jgi:hypothetical protein
MRKQEKENIQGSPKIRLYYLIHGQHHGMPSLTFTIVRSGPIPLKDESYGDESFKGRIVQGTYSMTPEKTYGDGTYGDISSRHKKWSISIVLATMENCCIKSNCKTSTKHITHF